MRMCERIFEKRETSPNITLKVTWKSSMQWVGALWEIWCVHKHSMSKTALPGELLGLRLCKCALTPRKSPLPLCITATAGQRHSWYETTQQAKTDSEWLPLKGQTQQKRSDSGLRMNANLGEMEWGENNSICSHLLQSAKENRAGGGAGRGALSPPCRAWVAGAQISRGRAKINCLLWWKSKIKAIWPTIPSASLHECPYSAGTCGGDCVH